MFASAFVASVAARVVVAQTITGRVVDSAGVPVPRVRVLANPAGDTTASRIRLAITNERGEFRLALGERGVFDVSAVRIGLTPVRPRPVDIRSGDGRIELVMTTLSLGTVAVVGHADFGCLPLSAPRQSARVRDWVERAQELIRSRRAVEREYVYRVRETSGVLAGLGARGISFVQTPDDSSHVGEIPAWWWDTGRWRLTTASVSAGMKFWIWPDEGTLLRPSFSSGQCFDTTFVRVSRSEYEIRFRPGAGSEANFAGSLRMDTSGVITRVLFQHIGPGSSRSFDATLTYQRIDLDAMPFPFIVRVTDTYRGSADRRFSYSSFVRRPEPQVVAR